MIIGHSISSSDGIIQAIDESVATILQRTQKDLIGLSYISITHPDDLARNISQVAALHPNGNSARIRKRYIGGEGAVVTLEIQVSRLGYRDSGHLVGTLSTLPSMSDLLDCDPTPLRLWRRAQDLLGVMRARDEALGADLFADHAWATLLIIYVAEAEGRIASMEMVAEQLSLSQTTLSRWIHALEFKTLIEPNLDALQLTKTGIASVERLLATRAEIDVG